MLLTLREENLPRFLLRFCPVGRRDGTNDPGSSTEAVRLALGSDAAAWEEEGLDTVKPSAKSCFLGFFIGYKTIICL